MALGMEYDGEGLAYRLVVASELSDLYIYIPSLIQDMDHQSLLK